ncbi:hypothetical protein LE181_02420 [Streptomyces sp. SCA3-4]|nr:peptidase inhibitor family I36 protein [Streptomyces sichuanensis]MCA6091027.1 hypothetical protein [Streptomyces sichuanensis]
MSEVVFFSDANHKGKSAALGPGRHVLDESFNDTISSVRVPKGWTVTLFDGRNFDGESLALKSDALSLGSGINDRTSSLIIVDGNSNAVGDDSNGTSPTTQQQAVGNGASNQSNTAQVNGSAFSDIDQSNANVAVNFSELW